MCHSVKASSQAATLLVVLALATAAHGAENDGSAVQRYLGRLGLADLQTRYLERLVEESPDGEAKVASARKLADSYALMLMDVADDPARFEQFQARIDKLLRDIPQARTSALRVALLQADFQRAEALVQKWIESPADAASLQTAAEILQRTIPVLTETAKSLNKEAEALTETLETIRGQEARKSADAQITQSQLLAARAGYFAGWSNYYLGVTKRDPVAAAPEFTAAKGFFLDVLGIGDEKDYEPIEAESLGLESVWRARAVLGLALAETGLERLPAAQRCFRWLEHASAPASLRDQAAFWQLQGLLNVQNYVEATRFAELRVAGLNGPPTPGKNSFCVALIRAGATQSDPKLSAVAKPLVEIGIRGLAMMRQFDTLSQLVTKYNLGSGGGFYLGWLQGRQQFFAAEKSNAPADYERAATMLSAALALPDSQKDIFAAAQCRYHLAWCRFRLGDWETAARLFQETVPILSDGQKDLAVQAAWMEFASYQKLVDVKKDKKYASSAVAALQNLKRDFPDTQQAAKAELLIVRLQQDFSPAEALVALSAVKPGEANYLGARQEVVQLLFQMWLKEKGDAATRKKLAADVLEGADTYLAVAPSSGSGEAKLRVCLVALQVLLDEKDFSEAKAASYLQITKATAEALPDSNLLAAEYHYRKLQLSQKAGDKSAVATSARWLSSHAAGTPYELPALVIVARQADEAVATADDTTRKERQLQAAQIYARMAALLGDSPESLSKTKNALAVNSKLAHYDEELGRWKEAAARLDKIVTALPSDKKYLRRAGIAHFQAGEFAASLDLWRKLLGGLQSGSDEWFEAKYHQLVCLSKTDKPGGLKVWKQFKLLFPEVTSPAWKDRFVQLEKQFAA